MSRDSGRPLDRADGSVVIDDLVDFDAMESDPRFAEALADAEARAALRHTLVAQRKAAGLTQKQIARAMETTQSAVSDFERGEVDPHLSTLQRYARAIGATVVVRVSLPGQQASATTWLDDVRRTGYRRRGIRTVARRAS